MLDRKLGFLLFVCKKSLDHNPLCLTELSISDRNAKDKCMLEINVCNEVADKNMFEINVW